jgi:hypothetical protein
MLQKIASNWLNKVINKIHESNEERNKKQWLQDYHNPKRLAQINRIPEQAVIDDQGIWHMDSVINEPVNKDLKNYNYKEITKRIQHKLLPEFHNNIKEWITNYPEVKTLKLKGINRILDKNKTPVLYQLTVGSSEDKYFDAEEALDHSIIADPALTYVDIEG